MHVLNGSAITTDYCGNVIYESGTQKLLLTEEGYVNLANSNTYYYYLKDHQGNNRVVINSSGTVAETNHYYPFGGTFASTNAQPYKYNGKELDSKNGLNWYDYGARHYDATLGRWFVVDPLAEKDYLNSSYSYCGDNPIVRIDPNGKIWDTVWDIGNVLYDIGSAIVSHISGDHEKAQEYWMDAGSDVVAMAVPFVPAGASKVVKIARKSEDVGSSIIRGRISETKVLQEIGEVKNTLQKKSILPETNEIVTTIPDAINDTKIIEIKDVKRLSNTRQIRAERQVAKDEGKTFEIITGEKTHVSKNIPKEEIVRRKDLGPQ